MECIGIWRNKILVRVLGASPNDLASLTVVIETDKGKTLERPTLLSSGSSDNSISTYIKTLPRSWQNKAERVGEHIDISCEIPANAEYLYRVRVDAENEALPWHTERFSLNDLYPHETEDLEKKFIYVSGRNFDAETVLNISRQMVQGHHIKKPSTYWLNAFVVFCYKVTELGLFEKYSSIVEQNIASALLSIDAIGSGSSVRDNKGQIELSISSCLWQYHATKGDEFMAEMLLRKMNEFDYRSREKRFTYALNLTIGVLALALLSYRRGQLAEFNQFIDKVPDIFSFYASIPCERAIWMKEFESTYKACAIALTMKEELRNSGGISDTTLRHAATLCSRSGVQTVNKAIEDFLVRAA